MSDIDRNLMPSERILFRTRKHPILFFYPVLLTIVAFYAGDYMRSDFFLRKVEFAPWLVALILWCYTGLEYVFSEYAVTNKRVMMREGFFIRHGNELRLSTISQVSFTQSILGRLLDYGTVTINAFGANDVYTLINHPALFQQSVNRQLDSIVKPA